MRWSALCVRSLNVCVCVCVCVCMIGSPSRPAGLLVCVFLSAVYQYFGHSRFASLLYLPHVLPCHLPLSPLRCTLRTAVEAQATFKKVMLLLVDLPPPPPLESLESTSSYLSSVAPIFSRKFVQYPNEEENASLVVGATASSDDLEVCALDGCVGDLSA
jgi:hypothetical protein